MKIFIIDDEEFSRSSLKDFISRKFPDASVDIFSTGEAALQKIDQQPEVAILDYYLDLNDTTAANGVEILKRIRERSPKTHVILLSSQESTAIASDIMKYGAYDYVVKGNTAFERLQILIERIRGYGTVAEATQPSKIPNILLLVVVLALIAWIIISRLH